jgi:hypothetical protein
MSRIPVSLALALPALLQCLPTSAWGRSVSVLTPPFALDTGGEAAALGSGHLGLAALVLLAAAVLLRGRLGLLRRSRLLRARAALPGLALLCALLPAGRAAQELELRDALAVQRPGTGLVEIRFTLHAPAGERVRIDCELSRDGGLSWEVPARSLQGDLGDSVEPGPERLILWDAAADEPAALGTAYVARLTAQTSPFVLMRPIRTTHEQTEYFYAFRARAQDLSAVSYRLVQGPEGMKVDPATGDVLWRPQQPGTFPGELAAAAAGGAETAQAFELRVLEDLWRAGDLHVHTTHSTDGTRGDPDQYRERARTVWTRKPQGLDWLTFSDHTDTTDGDYPTWDDAARLTTPDFVVIPGSEVSNRFDGHFGAIPRDLASFDHSGDYRTRWEDPSATNQEQLDEIRRRGGWSIVNHPFGPLWLKYDFSSKDFDAIEIWNGGGHNNDLDSKAVEWWLDLLGEGLPIVAVGGSDCHRYDEPRSPKLGEPTTHVWARRLDFASLTAGLFAGRVVVADHDNFLELRARAGWSGHEAMIGDTLELAPGEPVRFSMVGHCRYGSDVKLWALHPGQRGRDKRLLRSVHTPNGFTGRSSFEVHVTEVPAGDTIYYAETHHLALPLDNVDYVRTNALRVRVR